MTSVKALQVKVRSGQAWLNAAAREVNLVWNYANEVSQRAAKPFSGKPRYLSGYDLGKLTAGATACLEHMNSGMIESVCHKYAGHRRVAKHRLRWRRSSGSRRSLGWVPFKAENIRFKGNVVVLAGRRFRVFDSFGLANYKLRAGSFAENALGEWFLNIAVEVADQPTSVAGKAIGVDLGLKSVAVCSDGTTLPALSFYRDSEQEIAQAQRRGHKRQAKRLHLKARNRRKDALHKFSARLVRENGCIYVGDVSAPKLVKTRMAKSVLESGWGILKEQLLSKGHRAGVIVGIVNERNTTRVCSSCGCASGPSGLRQLAVRQWRCSECGAEHDRDVNSARNILAVGLGKQPPFAGTTRRTKASVRPGSNSNTADQEPTK